MSEHQISEMERAFKAFYDSDSHGITAVSVVKESLKCAFIRGFLAGRRASKASDPTEEDGGCWLRGCPRKAVNS